MINKRSIGVDMGGTNIRAAALEYGQLAGIISEKINAGGSETKVLEQLYALIDKLFTSEITSIGIGVPGLVDSNTQIVYDVVNIPAWKKIALAEMVSQRYHVPVYVNNDANCFALGEYHFGKGNGSPSMVGLTIGTGLGSGIIIDGKLYNGRNGGAGEFGMIPYRDQVLEYYASGQFFKNVYNLDGVEVFAAAKRGDLVALSRYQELGIHLANAISIILLALDTELIVIGGSVRHAFDFFEKSLWSQLAHFPYSRAVKNLRIEVSELENSGLLGAASLSG